MKKILIVDDSWVARMGLSRMLSSHYHISETDDGLKALNFLQTNEIDLILLDILMPGMDGTEVLKELKKRNIAIPVIVLSADIQETTKKRTLALGAKAYLNKPPKAKELLDTVEKLTKDTIYEV